MAHAGFRIGRSGKVILTSGIPYLPPGWGLVIEASHGASLASLTGMTLGVCLSRWYGKRSPVAQNPQGEQGAFEGLETVRFFQSAGRSDSLIVPHDG